MNDTSELTTTLTSIRTEITALQGIPGTVKSLQDQFTQLNEQLSTLRRQSITRSLITQPRIPGVVGELRRNAIQPQLRFRAGVQSGDSQCACFSTCR